MNPQLSTLNSQPGSLARLQPGMIVAFAGTAHRVVLVNECRARIVPVAKRTKEFLPRTGRHADQPLRLVVSAGGHNISPESELEILGIGECEPKEFSTTAGHG